MRDIIFSLIHDSGIPGILRRLRIKNKELSILMFHRVTDEIDPLWPAISTECFGFLMRELSLRAHVIPLENIKEVKQYPDKPLVALSFDDGYMDFWENALGVLLNYRLPAHHNICPELVDRGIPPWTQILNIYLQSYPSDKISLPNGRNYHIGSKLKEADFIKICNDLYGINDQLREDWMDNLMGQIPKSKIAKMMDWDKIKECAKLGIHIGSHGMKHLNTSKIDSKEALLTEIADSRRKIYEKTGIQPLIFAFPNGLYNKLGMSVVKESGYKIALLCDEMSAVFPRVANKEDFYVFPRINICRADWKEENLRSLGLHQKLKKWMRGSFFV